MFRFRNDALVLRHNCTINNFCEQNNISKEEFNYPIYIPEGIKDCSDFLSGCISFNHPVVIPEGVENCSQMFSNCQNFNQTVKIPNSVRDCDKMFNYCKKLNSKIHIPMEVETTSLMFRGCCSFNQPIVLPSLVRTCDLMFLNCTAFNQPLTIPPLAERIFGILRGCTGFSSRVTILRPYNEKKYLGDIMHNLPFMLFATHDINPEIALSDDETIKWFDQLLKYHIENGHIERAAYLMQFKHDYDENIIQNYDQLLEQALKSHNYLEAEKLRKFKIKNAFRFPDFEPY